METIPLTTIHYSLPSSGHYCFVNFFHLFHQIPPNMRLTDLFLRSQSFPCIGVLLLNIWPDPVPRICGSLLSKCGRCGGLMVSAALDSGSSGPGSIPGPRTQHNDPAGQTLYSHSASLGTATKCRVDLRWTSIPSRGSNNTPSRLHETGISSGSVGQFGPRAALPHFYCLKDRTL